MQPQQPAVMFSQVYLIFCISGESRGGEGDGEGRGRRAKEVLVPVGCGGRTGLWGKVICRQCSPPR